MLVCSPNNFTNKLEHRSKPGIMIGYSTRSKVYKVWDTESRTLIISRDVKFDESSFSSSTSTLEDSEEHKSIRSSDRSDRRHWSSQSENWSKCPWFKRKRVPKCRPWITPALRRSSSIRKQAGQWWKEAGHNAQAFSAKIVQTSYRIAVSLANIGFWKPGIDREMTA